MYQPREIDPLMLLEHLEDYCVLDIREEKELCGEEAFFPDYTHIPMIETDEIESFILDSEKPVVLLCASGTRAYTLQSEMDELGFDQTLVLNGGIQKFNKVRQ